MNREITTVIKNKENIKEKIYNINEDILANYSGPILIISKPKNNLSKIYDKFTDSLSALWLSSKGTFTIIKENGGPNNMTDNELRDSIKKQVGTVIDDIYINIVNANGLKSDSKYSFNITITNPTTKEVINKKISLQGDQLITIKDFVNRNRVKSNAIKKILKKEAWKIVYSMIKEDI